MARPSLVLVKRYGGFGNPADILHHWNQLSRLAHIVEQDWTVLVHRMTRVVADEVSLDDECAYISYSNADNRTRFITGLYEVGVTR